VSCRRVSSFSNCLKSTKPVPADVYVPPDGPAFRAENEEYGDDD
jgi:hypothetical protein